MAARSRGSRLCSRVPPRGLAGVQQAWGRPVGLVPVGGPLPDVADHVVQAVAVGRVAAHRGRPCVAVQLQVLDRELALPGVGCHGPTMGALQALGPDRAGALKAELVEVARRFDVSEDDTLVLQLDYLEVVVGKPAWL